MLFLSIPLLVMAATPSVHAEIFTVGIDPGGSCTHANLQAALDAASVGPGADEVRVTIGDGHTGPLRIRSGDIHVRGGYATCNAEEPSARSIVSGAGGKMMPVLDINPGPCSGSLPAIIRIEGFEFVNGPDHGLLIRGCSSVQLTRSRILENLAAFGAGIAIDGGSGGNTSLVVGDDVRIEGNRAASAGGGIYALAASVRLGGVGTVVRGNEVTGSDGVGGGIAIVGTTPLAESKLSIVSGGEAGDGIVSGNFAPVGGGLWILGNVSIEAYTTDPARPVRFSRNLASRGGAVSMDGVAGFAPQMIVVEGVIDANTADYGAALELKSGARFLMQALPAVHPADATSCNPGADCNRLRGNASLIEGVGATVVLMEGLSTATPTTARFTSVRIEDNDGDNLFAEPCIGNSCPTVSMEIVNSLLAGNTIRHVLHARGVARFSCNFCTLTNSTPSIQPLFRTSGNLTLSNSVIWEPGRPVIGGGVPSSVSAHALQLHERSAFPPLDFPPELDIEVGNPHFVATTFRDFRPGINSPLLDRAGVASSIPFDLDGRPRAVDQPGIPDRAGIVDLGAFEREDDGASSERVFADGFDPPGAP
jgi:hypothetical protein